MHPQGRNGAFAIVAAIAAAAVAMSLFSPSVPNALFRARMLARKHLEHALRGRDGLLLCARIADAHPVNDANRTAVQIVGVSRTGDGAARRFSGRDGEVLRFPNVRWNALAHGGTVFLRFNLGGKTREQRLVWEGAGDAVFGVRTLEGRVEAVFNDDAGAHVLSGAIPDPQSSVGVAFAFSPGGDAALYIDGAECARTRIAGSSLKIGAHPVAIGASPCALPDCDISSLAAWTRPLPAGEVAALPRDPGDAAAHRPFGVLLVRVADAAFDAWRALARMADRVVPSFVRPGGEIPDLSLVVSKKDGRHFMKVHGGALSNGFFTRDASRTRNISVVFRDTAFKAEASLADIYTLANLGPHDIRTAPSTRPAFLVKASPGLLCGGTGAALLYPPEAFSVFHPDAPAPLPLDTGGAVRLFVGGEMRGLYIMESLDRIGSAWMATGPYDKARPKFVLSSAPPTVPAWQVGLTPSGISRLFRRAAAFFESDPAFPWSRAEAAWQAKQHTKRRALWGFPAPEISALDLKGGNESPHFVVSDLDLKAAGEGVKWVSSRPDVISDEGALLARPDAPGGTVVELSAAFPGGERRTFRFRVMPPRLRLPALFLHVSRPVPYDGKTAFSATRFPALSDGSAAGAEHLVGADGAGVHLRGNTSLLKGAKRPLSLEFDEPVPWSGAPGGSRHVLLLSGYADPTRLRNAFSFHAFRLMSPENAGLCVPVSWTELFVNGEYYGVWESCPRLCDVVRREALSLLKVRSPDGFWTEVSADMVDDALKGRGGVADPYRDFLALSRLVVEAPGDEFAAKWRDEFDGGNLGDYWLLLNFTGDKDGMRTNQFIMRRASDGRAVVCPWDCDKTFERRRAYSAILGNPLIRRVEAADPDFRRKCGEKWKALRQGPLSDAAVEAWIDEKAAVFAPLMAEEWHLLKPEGYDGSFDEAVQHLKEEISARAALLDSRF